MMLDFYSHAGDNQATVNDKEGGSP